MVDCGGLQPHYVVPTHAAAAAPLLQGKYWTFLICFFLPSASALVYLSLSQLHWRGSGDAFKRNKGVFYIMQVHGKWWGWDSLSGFLWSCNNLNFSLLCWPVPYIESYKESLSLFHLCNTLGAPWIGGAGSFLLCCLDVSIVCICKQHICITQLHYRERGKISPMYFWILQNVLAPGLFAFDPVSLSGEHREPHSSLQQWELIFCSQYLKSSKKIKERDRQMGRGEKRF